MGHFTAIYRQRLRQLLFLVLGAACTARCVSGAEPDANAQFRQCAQRAQTALVGIRSGFYETLGVAATRAPGKVRRVTATLDKALAGKDLVLDLFLLGEEWIAALGYCPTASSMAHSAVPNSLRLSGEAKSVTLRGNVDVRIAYDGLFPLEGKPVDISLKLRGDVSGGRLKGSFSLTTESWIPKASGRMSGTVDTAANAPTLPVKLKPVDVGRMDAFYCYPCAEAYAAAGAELYRRARAVLLAVSLNRPVADLIERSRPLQRVRLQFGSEPAAVKAAVTKPQTITLDDMDGGLDDLGLEDEDHTEQAQSTTRTSAAEHPRYREAFAMIRDMAERTERMSAALRAQLDAGVPVRAIEDWGTDPGDPAFTPSLPGQPLPLAKDGTHSVSPVVPSTGRQQWSYVSNWRVLAPFPRVLALELLPLMPAEFESPVSDYYSRIERYAPPGSEAGDAAVEDVFIKWVQPVIDEHTGRAVMPVFNLQGSYKANSPNAPVVAVLRPFQRYSSYARTEITAPTDMAVWVCLYASQYGRLYVNDRLACAGPRIPDPDTLTALVAGTASLSPTFMQPDHNHADALRYARVNLKKGRNRFVLRCDSDLGPTTFSLHVCATGTPRPAAEVERARAAGTPALPDNTWGWRGKWNGIYPDANPPLAWDLDKGINILWQTPLPTGHAGTVPMGNRLVTTANPDRLVCLDRDTGKVLWQRTCNVLEAIDATLLPRYRELDKAYTEARDALYGLGLESSTRLTTLKNRGMTDAEAEKACARMAEAHRAAERAWFEYLKKHAGLQAFDAGFWMRGLAKATPVTDGTHVFARFGTGAVACYDGEGNQKWLINAGPFRGATIYTSPLLLDGRLIVLNEKQLPGRPKSPILQAFDCATGKEVWQTPVAGTENPVAIRLSAGQETVSLAISSDGDIVRAEDGRIVGRVPCPAGRQYPAAVAENRLYYRDSDPNSFYCFELYMHDRDHVAAKPLWARYAIGRHSAVTPAAHGGLLYAYRGRGGDQAFEIFDALTGQHAQTLGQPMWTSAAGVHPTSVAGSYVFFSDNGYQSSPENFRLAPGAISTVQQGPAGLILARNKIEKMREPPLFLGDRIYCRTRTDMTCIGITDDEGRGFQAHRLAENVLDWIYPETPVACDPIVIEPTRDRRGMTEVRTRDYLLPVANPINRATRENWTSRGTQLPTRPPKMLYAGPFDLDDRDAVLASIGDFKEFAASTGTMIGPGDRRMAFDDMGIRFLRRRRTGYSLDLLAQTYGEPGKVGYYFTSVLLKEPKTYRLELLPSENTRLWIQGVRVKHQERVSLKPGWYTMILEAVIPDPAPPAMLLSFQFWRSDDQAAEMRRHKTTMAANRNILNDSLAWAAGTRVAALAESHLETFPDWRKPEVKHRIEEEALASSVYKTDPVQLGKPRDTRIVRRAVKVHLENAARLTFRMQNDKWLTWCWMDEITFVPTRKGYPKSSVQITGDARKFKAVANLTPKGYRTSALITIEATVARDDTIKGTYSGNFRDRQFSGKVSGRVLPPWPALIDDWDPVAPNEHPRIMFRRKDLPALRRKMATPQGKVILNYLKQVLRGRFSNGHAAAYGLLWQLTGEKSWAYKCRGALEDLIAGRCEADNRYWFMNPNGQLRAGPALGVVALGYDLGYDSFDDEFRKKMANVILNHSWMERIVLGPAHGPGCNHYGAHQGGVGTALLAIRGDDGLDHAKLEMYLQKIIDSGPSRGVKGELLDGFSRYGYYYEGHHCGRISRTGIYPFINAMRNAAGYDCTKDLTNAQWLLARWVYEFIPINGVTHNLMRGMYAGPTSGKGWWSGGGDYCIGLGFTPEKYLPGLLWAYDNCRDVIPEKRTYADSSMPSDVAWSFVNWPTHIEPQNPEKVFPRVHADPDPGYYVFRNGWTGTPEDVVVTAILGSKPGHGRGMAAGGSVLVLGMGLRAEFPGAFFWDKTSYFKAESDGSGVLSARQLPNVNTARLEPDAAEEEGQARKNVPGLADSGMSLSGALEDAVQLPASSVRPGKAAPVLKRNADSRFAAALAALQADDTEPTALAVDYSGECGAPVLIAMTGHRLGKQIGYWMQYNEAEVKDVTGAGGAFTRTTPVLAGKRPYYIMTVQYKTAPTPRVEGDKVVIGDVKLWFDGEKIVVDK